MQLEQFVEQLEGTEQVEYQALVEESQNGVNNLVPVDFSQ